MTSQALEAVKQWRHHLHRHPEPGFEEHTTAAFIADKLRSFGLDVRTGIGGTGVVGTLKGGTGDRTVGLRADMDALKLVEAQPREYASQNPGVMHACGHDGHMAMLLGAAQRLSHHGAFNGTVQFVFQPAEEHGRGAQAMIDDRLFERFGIEAMYGLHNMPGIPTGDLHTRTGPIMASEDNFTIEIHGHGGHAARPHMVIDPLVIAAQIILALQTVVARSIDPAEPAVVSCTGITHDGTRNAIPGRVTITGDTRSYREAVQQLLEQRIRDISIGLATTGGATCVVSYTHEFQPTVNHPAPTGTAVKAARAAVGRERVHPSPAPVMASEDFARYGKHVPTCFVFIGNGTAPGQGGDPLHSTAYDFNDEALSAGIRFYDHVVHQHLGANA